MIDELLVQGDLLVAAARAAGVTAAVPSCPGWLVADLLAHVGEVHRWAANIVATWADGEAESTASLGEVPRHEQLPDWVGLGCQTLVDTLRAAPGDLACWYFFSAPSPLQFWARRQLHETSVHRMDAQIAAGTAISPVPDAVAQDGIDELLTGFLPRPKTRLRWGEPRSMLVAPDDVDARWTVFISTDPPVTVREAHTADVVVRGPVGQLYPLLWNRLSLAPPGIRVDGDAALLELWRSLATVRWS